MCVCVQGGDIRAIIYFICLSYFANELNDDKSIEFWEKNYHDLSLSFHYFVDLKGGEGMINTCNMLPTLFLFLMTLIEN